MYLFRWISLLTVPALTGCLFLPISDSSGRRAQVLSPALTAIEMPAEFTEPFQGGEGFRFKIRNVQIEGGGPVLVVERGGTFEASLELLHDCVSCGNAVNQVIVGLGGEPRAQASIWNGKQRSGGETLIVNPGTDVQALAQDNPGPAEWVTLRFPIQVPDAAGDYFLRARYAQDYQGNLRTEDALRFLQPVFPAPLGWWTVDRPDGPGPESNIGAIRVITGVVR